MRKKIILSFIATVWLLPAVAFAQGNILQILSVALDPPTLHTLGVQMKISGDDNRNAKVAVRYRPVNPPGSLWKDGLPLFRVFPEVVTQVVPQQFAGSIFDLTPNTAYEIELHSTDTDGPVNDTRIIKGTTRPVPRSDPTSPNTVNVSPTPSGETISFQAALTNAAPGDVIVLANGTYTGSFSTSSSFAISKSGTATNPIVIRGASQTGVILDGLNCPGCRVLEISGSFIHIENLTIQNAFQGIRYFGPIRNNVFRRLQIKDVWHGMDGGNDKVDFYVCDNVIEGRVPWSEIVANTRAFWDYHGVGVSGNGHVICHNVLKGFGDPIYNGQLLNRSFDVYGNDFEIGFSTELDRSAGNARLFHNRYTNFSHGISFQPIHGGPAYALRNVIYNALQDQLKFQGTNGQPSGMLVYHNTFVSHKRAWTMGASENVYNFDVRNNLFVGPSALGAPGTIAGRTAHLSAFFGTRPDPNSCTGADPDSHGAKINFNGYFPDGGFLMGSDTCQLYDNFADLTASGQKHPGLDPGNWESGGTLLSRPIFATDFVGPADGTVQQNPADFTLAGTSNARDRGTVLLGINQGYTGAAPDLGALETGCPDRPIYGPRPLGSEHLTSLIDCGQPPPSDTTKPVISSVSASFITSSGAKITWTTDEASDSQVEYGTTTAYGSSTPINTTLVTSHSMSLSGLTANTLYHYRVKSRDAFNNLATSGDFTFTTAPSDTTPSTFVAAYGFNEGSGSVTADASSNSNTGTLNGATWTTVGKFGNALSFNGTSSYVEAPDINALTPGTGATFEAWVFLNSTPTTEAASVINKWSDETSAKDEYLIGINPAPRAGFPDPPTRTLHFAWHTTGGGTWGTTTSFNESSGTGAIPLNTWTHIAVVRSGTNLTFYINGNVDATRSNVIDTNPFHNGISTLRLGGQGRGGKTRFFNGTIDEVRIHNRALSQTEIQNDMNTPPVSLEAVVWTNLVNVTATGNSLKKTSGCDGGFCSDAGATSKQQIISGDGYFEFTALETNKVRFAGLGNGNTSTSGGDIEFSIWLRSDGEAHVTEGCCSRHVMGAYATGDVFRVAVEGGVVKYYQNGILHYTSLVAPTYPLVADTAFVHINATINNAIVKTP